MLSIEEFINPIEEIINDQDDDIMAAIVAQYSTNKEGIESEPEEDDLEAPKVSITKAIQALETLKLYTIQQDDSNDLVSQALDKLARDLLQKKRYLGKQSTINRFFTPNNL